MKRLIFTAPIVYDEQALFVEMYIKADPTHTDESLAQLLQITPREVRTIIERINYNKYLGIEFKYQYRKINGKYAVIDFHSEHKQRVIDKIKFDMIASIKRYGITSNKLSDVGLLNLTLKDIIEMEIDDNENK